MLSKKVQKNYKRLIKVVLQSAQALFCVNRFVHSFGMRSSDHALMHKHLRPPEALKNPNPLQVPLCQIYAILEQILWNPFKTEAKPNCSGFKNLAWKRLLHSKNSLLLSNLRGRLIKWFAELGFDALQVFLVNSLSFRSWESRKQSETNESDWQWPRILANFAALAMTPFQRFGNPYTCSQAVLRASVLRALHRSRIQWCKIRYSK